MYVYRVTTASRNARLWLVAAIVALLATGCSTSVSIQHAIASGDGTELDLSLDSCNRTYRVTVEEADGVTVSVFDAKRRSPLTLGSDDCADRWLVTLAEPLGRRAVFDGSSGAEIEVTHEPWNQQLYTEDEYRLALEATAECIVAADETTSVRILDGEEGPYLDVSIRELDDGESGADRTYECGIEHLDPFRR
ncbi:MAG: hypothetical protein QNL12_11300 [Acidimicrobiia bacterium]|nr:hypothetical protein [Acidimicrobiia bacterium]MDX2467891.1 hypothetical protein [Acidimicrobiia bacterium]